ncbi:penicillin-binding protein [bacterium]|nr:penicillin-binding protein [bacterium]MCP5461774.1 penicillin-binding protein [bacterium]
MRNNTNSVNKRLFFLASLIGILFCAICGRLYYLQFMRRDYFVQLAEYQHIAKVKLLPERGLILDRNKQPLAINVQKESLFADPREIDDPYLYAYKLARLIDVNEKELYKKLASKKSFVWIKRKVEEDEANKVKELNLKGIYTRSEAKRVYPNNELLSHVIGFAGIDMDGLEGLELAFDNVLNGEQGWRIVAKDAKRREVAHFIPMEKPVKNGNTIELTIDKVIQYIAEEALDRAYHERKPIWTGIIIMRPSTGEILAMATRPTYDPNRYSEFPAEYRRNRVITDMYEPGSTFKTISCASALDYGVVRFTDVFDCQNGRLQYGGHTLRDSYPHQLLTFPEIIAVSSNIGAAKVAMNLGKEKLYEYLCNFEFGVAPDTMLLGETEGILRDVKSWSKLSILSIPMGHEISVSPLQLLKGISAVANGGILMKPYIIQRIVDDQGRTVQEFKPHKIRQVISHKTAKAMNEALKMVVQPGGTAIRAEMEEYTVAGKTGTAQKVIDGRYSQTKYVGSFVGYVPADDPQISMIVLFDEPKGHYWGGVIAAPVFKEVAQKVLQYLEILPDRKTVSVDDAATKDNGV